MRARRRETLFEPLTWRRGLLYLLAMPAVFLALYLLFMAVGAARQGYAWRQMDWNGDGRTSVAEFFRSNDVGTRGVRSGGRICTEFFALKDARPIRLECPTD